MFHEFSRNPTNGSPVLRGSKPCCYFITGLVVVDVLHSSVVREWNDQNPHCSIEAGMLVMEAGDGMKPGWHHAGTRELQMVDDGWL